MEFDTIILEKSEGIARITFNRPKVFNACSEQMSRELKASVSSK